ncbi:hypothetical protein D3C71_2232040 [compost metagenome]
MALRAPLVVFQASTSMVWRRTPRVSNTRSSIKPRVSDTAALLMRFLPTMRGSWISLPK